MANHTTSHLLHLLDKNKVFASFHYIANLPDSVDIPNRDKLVVDLQRKITKARKLTANINLILEEGDYPKALRRLRQAQCLVSDFPNIQTDIDFITASISTAEKNLKEATLLASKGDKQRVSEILKTVQEIDKNNNAISKVEKRLSRSRRNKSLTKIISVGLVLVLPFVYFSFEKITLQQADELWSRADALIQTQQYDQAEIVIKEMDSRLRFVRLTGQADKVRLLDLGAVDYAKRTEVEKVIASDDVHTSGNERYVKSLLLQAGKNVSQGNYEKAITLYDDALTFSDKNIHIDKQIVAKINQQRNIAVKSLHLFQVNAVNQEFALMSKAADSLFRNDNWNLAASAYKDILTFIQNKNIQDLGRIAFVNKGYVTSVINRNIEDGEVAFNQRRYTDAIASFQGCVQFMEEQHLVDQNVYSNIIAKLHTVRKKQFMVKLSRFVNAGDQLFQDKEYELSADNYGAGLTYLSRNNGQIPQDKAELIQKNIEAKMFKAEEGVLVLKQSQHLVATYKKILRNNFNLSRNIHFKSPEVVFIGNKDNHLIYTVSAFGVKSRSASPVKYELDYKFNIHTGKWNVNDIRLEV